MGESGPPRTGVGHVTGPGSWGPVSRAGAQRLGVCLARGASPGVREDLVDHRRLRNECDDAHRAAADRTRERVDLQELLQEGRPSPGGLGRRESWRGNDLGRPVRGGGRRPPPNAEVAIRIALHACAEKHGSAHALIEAGKPNQNASVERFNRTFRHEVLDAWVVSSLAEVRAVCEDWRLRDNTERAHNSLGSVTPQTFLLRPTSTAESDLRLCA